MKKISALYIIISLCLLSSCKKFVDIPLDETLVDAKVVFSTDLTAIAAVNGMYRTMLDGTTIASGTASSLVALAGLSADELKCYDQNVSRLEFNENKLLTDNDIVLSIWQSSYNIIYLANNILEGLSRSNGVNAETRKQLEGEALFVRAFVHFYLVNLFGDIPLVTGTDYRVNAKLQRTTVAAVYDQIIADLIAAKEQLSPEYTENLFERVRPNRAAAIALLARVYLYKKDWAKAEQEATLIINDSLTYQINIPLSDVFLSTSTEAIWQLKPIQQGYNTWEGQVFILTASPEFNAISPYAMTDELYAAFDDDDLRKQYWVGMFTDGVSTWHFPYKYKISEGVDLFEYSMVLRTAEQYLIRSEARARTGDFTGAQEDINVIRTRANLANTTANDEPSLIAAIEQERRIEFFAEYGHRWLDLKRWERADAVLPALKPDWNTEDQLYPLPRNERRTNPNLKPQNPGYAD